MKTSLPLIIALAAFVSGCAHFRTYDAVVAESARALYERTREVVADGNAGRLSLAESRRFLRQSQAQVRVMRGRTNQCRMSPDELNMLDWLDGEYAALLRQSHPLRGSSAVKLQNTLATLQTLRPVVDFGVVTETATTTDDSFDNNTCDAKKRDCDKDHDRHHDHDHDHHDHDHDHGGHDHGDKDCGGDRDHR